MPENDFLPFATAPGANVLDQADYAALPAVQSGYVQGTALSAQLNKTWRQSSVVASAWARFIAQQLGLDVIDDGNLVGLTGMLLSAMTTTMFVDTGQGGNNALVCTPPTVPAGVFPNSVIWVRPANTNTGSATLNLGIGGNIPLVRLDGNPLQPGDYQAGRPFPATYSASRFSMLLARTTQELGGNITLTADAVNGSDLTGSLANPFRTLQAAWNFVATNYNLNSYSVTVNCSGNFTAGLAVGGNTVDGQGGPGQMTFNFAVGSSVTTPADAFLAAGPGGMFNLQGPVLISCSGSGSAIRIFDNAVCSIGGVNFGACGVVHMLLAENCRLIINDGGYTISGGAEAHYYLYDAARVRPGALTSPVQTITVLSNPTFTNAFAAVGALSLVSLPGVSTGGGPYFVFSGPATGTRYTVSNNGVIASNGAGANFLPGNAPGTPAPGVQGPTGGIYS